MTRFSTSALWGAIAVSTCVLAALSSSSALAQDAYPNKPVMLVVQAAAGGGNDALARRFAEQMQKKLKQPVIVDNRAGAGGAIGSESVARATPDGYTLLLITAGETYYKAINPSVRFNVETDFTPITLLAKAPLLLVANASQPYKTVAELVSYAKSKPGELSYGSAGVGSPHHLAGEMFKKAAGIDISHVPYRGTGLAVQDLLAGQIALAWSSPAAVQPHIQAGKLRAIALADSERLSTMPDVPTIAESGYPSVKLDNWFGIAGPKGMSPAIVKKFADVLMEIGKDPEFAQRIETLGFQPILLGPAEFEARIKTDHAKYTKVAEALVPAGK